MLDSPVDFHELKIVEDGADILVARADLADFVVLPADGGALLTQLVGGMPPKVAASWYRETYLETVDIVDFLESMGELGFLRSDHLAPAVPVASAVRYQALARALFSWVAASIYAGVIVVWLGLILADKIPPPHSQDVFFSSSITAVQLFLVFGQTPWIFLHEGAHMLAGRRLGLPSKLYVSNRLYVIAFETRMDALIGVPRRQRYLPFLAGMIIDVVAISVLSIFGQTLRRSDGLVGNIGELMVASVIPIIVRLAYQFLLYLRTDIYYVLVTAWGCHDLHGATSAMLRNSLWRVLRRPEQKIDLNQWTDRDRQVARWYQPMFAVGAGVLILVALLIYLPIISNFASVAWESLGARELTPGFWDSLIFLALLLGQFALAGFVAWRERRGVAKAHGPGR